MTPRAWLGLAFVVVTIAVTLVAVSRAPGADTLLHRLGDHVSGRMSTQRVRFDARPRIFPGDPVYVVEKHAFALSGRVRAVEGEQPCEVTLSLDPSVMRRLGAGTTAEAMAPDKDLAWVVRTLVPPDLRRELVQELRGIWEQEKNKTLDELKPALLELLGDLTDTLGETLPEVLARHEEELHALVSVVREEIYAEELKPVIEDSLVPQLERHLGGTAGGVGAAIGARIKWRDVASVLWASIKDKVGLGRDREIEEKLAEVLRNAALPVLKEKAPEIAKGAWDALLATVSDPQVQARIAAAARRLGDHPKFRSVLRDVTREWLLDNPRLKTRLRRTLDDPRLAAVADQLWKSAEPTLARGLERMLSRPKEEGEGMNHQLVRVLRRVVLKKDKRYVLLVPGDGAPLARESVTLRGVEGEDR